MSQTAEQVIEKLVPLFEQVNSLTEDAKAILKEAKDAGLDHVSLGKIAKAKANNKLSDLYDKTEALLDLMEPLV